MDNVGPLDVMHEYVAVRRSCVSTARAAAWLGVFLEWCRREEMFSLIFLAELFLYLCVVHTDDDVL